MKIFNLKFVTTAIVGLALSTSSYGQINSATMYKGSTVNAGSTGSYYGRNVTATGTYSFAGGYWSTSSGSYSLALGTRTQATNSHAIALGIDVRATSNRSMVLGTGVGNSTTQTMINTTPNSLMIGFNSTVPTLFVGESAGVGTTGKVGVGTTNTPSTIGSANISNYSLYVAGGMLAEEVRVRTGWADYVFKDDYKLAPLSEVADYIEKNGHLPNVPSATEVEAEGIEIGDITRVQQEKIEELTLYVIELQKQMDELKEQLLENNEK